MAEWFKVLFVREKKHIKIPGSPPIWAIFEKSGRATDLGGHWKTNLPLPEVTIAVFSLSTASYI